MGTGLMTHHDTQFTSLHLQYRDVAVPSVGISEV